MTPRAPLVRTHIRVLCRVLVALTLVVLAGCSTVSGGSVQAASLYWHRHPKVVVTPASVASLAYYQLQVNAPGGQAVLILGSVSGDRLGWYAKGHQAIFMEHGLVVKTLGLPENLDRLALPVGNPFAVGLQRVSYPVSYTRTMDWSPGYRYGVTVRATLTQAIMENVDILGVTHALRRIDERLLGEGLDRENRYWVDPVDGFIWKSVQYIDASQRLEIIQLRPYRTRSA